MHRRNVLKSAGLLGFGALVPARFAIAAPADDAVLDSVHPELRQIAKGILSYRMEPLTNATLAKRRKEAGFPPKPLIDIPYEQRTIPGSSGQPEVSVYLINIKPGEERPAILYTHGGGFVTGNALSSVASLQKVCKELDCAAVSVEYRLAPETRFTGSIEDNYAGLKWLHDNARSLGVDRRRIAVMGDSAGGGHAALLAIAARDRGEIPLCFQCLVCPMLDDRTGSSRRMPEQVGKIIWTADDNRFGWESFLGAPPGSPSIRAGVPARVRDVSGLPPAWIGVGSIDLFAEEDIEYAQRLVRAGVATELIVVPGAFHGFDNPYFNAKVSRWFTAAKIEALRRAFIVS